MSYCAAQLEMPAQGTYRVALEKTEQLEMTVQGGADRTCEARGALQPAGGVHHASTNSGLFTGYVIKSRGD